MKDEKIANANLFSTSYNELKIDSELYDVVYNKGHFFISQASRKVAVLDTFFKRQYPIEDLINKFPITTIYQNNDSVIICKYDDKRIGFDETYYLTDNFTLKPFKATFKYSRIPREPLFEDSTYNIFVNRTGQSGFFTYFLEKATKKVFALFSHSPRQIVKFEKDYYILCDGIKRDSSNTGIIKIKNPRQLSEITIKQAEKLNILYTHLAASPGKEYEILAKKIQKQSISSYGYLDRYSIPIYSFQKNNQLYTIIKNDSSIYLGKHSNNKILEVQKLFDSSFDIDNIFSMKYNSSTLVIFRSSGGKMSNGIMIDYFDCGFFDIKDSKINLHRIFKENKSKWQ